MTKDQATLFAQFIPVVALALGLEIRAVGGKMAASLTAYEEGLARLRRSRFDPVVRGEASQAGARMSGLIVLLGTLTAIQAFLAAFETVALGVAVKSLGWSDQIRLPTALLIVATVAVFIAPCWEALFGTGAYFRLLAGALREAGGGKAKKPKRQPMLVRAVRVAVNGVLLLMLLESVVFGFVGILTSMIK